MTITSHSVVPLIEEYEDDQRPGSSDVSWAERAYRREEKGRIDKRRAWVRSLRRRVRALLALVALVLATVGIVAAMRYSGPSPSPVTHGPTSTQTVTVPTTTAGGTSFGPTPPLLREFPSLPPTFITPRR